MRHIRFTAIVLAVVWSAPLQATCVIQATGVSFGSYGPLYPNHNDSRGTIEVACDESAGSALTILIRLSSGTNGSFTPRSMKRGSARLSYGLYTDATRSQEWGDGS